MKQAVQSSFLRLLVSSRQVSRRSNSTKDPAILNVPILKLSHRMHAVQMYPMASSPDVAIIAVVCNKRIPR